MTAARWDAASSRAVDARVAPPPRLAPSVHVAVAGGDVAAASMRVVGDPTPQELHGSLATLVLEHEDDDVRSARSSLADAVAAVGSPVGMLARAEAALRAGARRLGLAGRVLAVQLVAAATIGVVGAPAWLLARDDAVLRDELAACALLVGVSMLVLATWVLVTARLGRDDDGARRQATTTEVVAIVAAAAIAAGMLAAVAHRATALEAWSLGVVLGLTALVGAVACGIWAVLAAFAPARVARVAPHLASGVVLAAPSVRLQALADRFDARIHSLDAASAATLRHAIGAEASRLAHRGEIDDAMAAAVRDVPVHEARFDAQLSARLALQPTDVVELRRHVPLAAVTAVLDGDADRARLVRRIVAAVAGRRSRAGVPWETGMLVDLPVAARVPVQQPGDRAGAVAAVGRGALLCAALAAVVGATIAIAAWREVATDALHPASAVGIVVLVTVAVVATVACDLLERMRRLRSTQVTGALAIAMGTATIAAVLVAAAAPYSAYLVRLRTPWVLVLAALAVMAATPLALRLVERLRGRAHDAVHWGSFAWPLSARRAEALGRRRDAAVRAASAAHVDALVVRLQPAFQLAVDLGRLDASVLASLPTPRASPRAHG